MARPLNWKIDHQHIRQLHKYPWLLRSYAIFRKNKIFGNIDASVKDLVAAIGESNDVSKRRPAFHFRVFGAKHFCSVLPIEKIGIRGGIEEIHGSEETILFGSAWILPGVGIRVEPESGERWQKERNI